MIGSCVRCIIEERIAFVTIDNPPVNALSNHVRQELGDVFSKLAQNEEIGAVIVTGGGNKAFVAGADINELGALNEETGKKRVQWIQDIFNKIAGFPVPVIAAINGYALGGGCELALCCDIRIASTKAKFGLPEPSLGIIPGAGGTQRLPRAIPQGRAKLMLFTGEMITANEALQYGLVEKVVPPEALIPECRAVAEKILRNGPLAIKAIKQAVQRGLELPLQQGLDVEIDQFSQLCCSEDKNEGVQAFVEKRAPNFNGK